MKITKKINGTTCLMAIEGAIVGSHALDLDRLLRSINFARLDNLVFDLTQASMIDSIGLEAINHAKEQGLRVSILNPQDLVKNMLERARLKKQLLPSVQIVEKDYIQIPAQNEPLPEMLEHITITSETENEEILYA